MSNQVMIKKVCDILDRYLMEDRSRPYIDHKFCKETAKQFGSISNESLEEFVLRRIELFRLNNPGQELPA